MKKPLLFLLSFFTLSLVLSSCKKDEDKNTSLNTTSASEIQKNILEGFWQLDSSNENSERTLQDAEYYYAFKFLNTKDHQLYYGKDKKSSNLWFYKITTRDGKAVFLTYPNQDAYDKDEPHSYGTYDVSIENGRLKMVRRSDRREVFYYKKYNTMNDTKDLPWTT